MVNETLILIVRMRFKIQSSQGLLTKNFTQFVMILAYHVYIVFLFFDDYCCVTCHENCTPDFLILYTIESFFFSVEH